MQGNERKDPREVLDEVVEVADIVRNFSKAANTSKINDTLEEDNKRVIKFLAECINATDKTFQEKVEEINFSGIILVGNWRYNPLLVGYIYFQQCGLISKDKSVSDISLKSNISTTRFHPTFKWESKFKDGIPERPNPDDYSEYPNEDGISIEDIEDYDIIGILSNALNHDKVIYWVDFLKGIKKKASTKLRNFSIELDGMLDKTRNDGRFIVNVDTLDGLPDYFKDLFNVIFLPKPASSIPNSQGTEKTELLIKPNPVHSPYTPVKKKWDIDKDKGEIIYIMDGKGYPIKLSPLLFDMFYCLYNEIGNYMPIKTIKKCWKDSPSNYSDLVPDKISKLKAAIKDSLNKQCLLLDEEIIRSNPPKKTKEYKLLLK